MISIIALLIAILLPAIGKARDAARVTQSTANLRNLAVANDTYASDWADRQFTAVADDMGLAGGSAGTYNSQIACMPQQLLGYDYLGRLWGWWCASGVQHARRRVALGLSALLHAALLLRRGGAALPRRLTGGNLLLAPSE